MYKSNWLRSTLTFAAISIAGVGAADDGGSRPEYPQSATERILYLSGMGSGLWLDPTALSMLSNEAPPAGCQFHCECTCSGDLCVMACRLECDLPPDPCQTKPQDPDDWRSASTPDYCI